MKMNIQLNKRVDKTRQRLLLTVFIINNYVATAQQQDSCLNTNIKLLKRFANKQVVAF